MGFKVFHLIHGMDLPGSFCSAGFSGHRNGEISEKGSGAASAPLSDPAHAAITDGGNIICYLQWSICIFALSYRYVQFVPQRPGSLIEIRELAKVAYCFDHIIPDAEFRKTP